MEFLRNIGCKAYNFGWGLANEKRNGLGRGQKEMILRGAAPGRKKIANLDLHIIQVELSCNKLRAILL